MQLTRPNAGQATATRADANATAAKTVVIVCNDIVVHVADDLAFEWLKAEYGEPSSGHEDDICSIWDKQASNGHAVQIGWQPLIPFISHPPYP